MWRRKADDAVAQPQLLSNTRLILLHVDIGILTCSLRNPPRSGQPPGESLLPQPFKRRHHLENLEQTVASVIRAVPL